MKMQKIHDGKCGKGKILLGNVPGGVFGKIPRRDRGQGKKFPRCKKKFPPVKKIPSLGKGRKRELQKYTREYGKISELLKKIHGVVKKGKFPLKRFPPPWALLGKRLKRRSRKKGGVRPPLIVLDFP